MTAKKILEDKRKEIIEEEKFVLLYPDTMGERLSYRARPNETPRIKLIDELIKKVEEESDIEETYQDDE